MAKQRAARPVPISVIRRRFKSLSTRLSRLAQRDAVDPQELAKLRAELVGLERMLRGRKRRRQGEGARTHILEYLKEHLGKPVFGEELREVSGIQEWARRVRELRVEFGYKIIEEGGRYTLTSLEPDPSGATRWAVANEIRRRPGDAKGRIAALLEKKVGEVVTLDELHYVAKIKEVGRRIRELRDNDGYSVSSHTERPELKPGEYVLERLPRR